MIPVLYSPDSTEFVTRSTNSSYIPSNGLGALTDCISCVVEEEVNGEYELEMEYPITGRHFSDIQTRSIILAQPYDGAKTQPFRVYSITTKISGKAVIAARHISYDMSNYVVGPDSNGNALSADNSDSAFAYLRSNTYVYPENCPFTISSDKGTVYASFKVEEPTSLRSVLGGSEGSLLDVYRGQYFYDDYSVQLNSRRGADRGVVISYGKNLTDYSQEQNCASVYTAVYPYWRKEDSNSGTYTMVTLDEKVVNCSGTYDHVRVMALDLSDSFDSAPTQEQLKAKAETYISNNDVGSPDVDWTISFQQLARVKEYSSLSLLEHVELGDTVHIYFDKLNVYSTATVSSYQYDVLGEKYKKIELGSVTASLADRIAESESKLEETPTVSMTEQISQKLSKIALGSAGGMVRILDTDLDGNPDTLFITDNPDPDEVTKVWRFNSAGWSASSDGGQTWTVGADLTNGILADFVTAAHLTSGTISSADWNGNTGTYHLDLTTGHLIMAGFEYDPSTKTVTIGAAGNQIRLKFDNDDLSFIDPNGNVIASFDPLGLHITGLDDTANIGLGKWRITHRNGFALRYAGEEAAAAST